MKSRNPIAKDLRTPKYKSRIVKSRKEYSRKKKHKTKEGIHKDQVYGLYVFPLFCLDDLPEVGYVDRKLPKNNANDGELI